MTTTKVNSEFIAVNAISGTIIADGAITSTHLAANCVDSSELVTGSIDTIHIAANQVTATKIVTNGVLTRHISDDQVTADKLANSINTDIAAKLPLAGGNITGSLGIGATSPAQALHIGGAGKILMERGGELRSKDTSGNEKTIVLVDSSNELAYGWSGAGAVKFMGGGSYTERIRIHTDGNVGIGTTSPFAKLHVGSRGSASALSYGSASDGIVFDFYNKAGSPYTRYANIVSSSSDTSESRLGLWTQAASGTSSEKLTILGDGKVGIGTTSPTTPLHVYHATTDTVANFQSGDNSVAVNFTALDNSMQIATSGTDGIIKNNGAGSFRLFNNGSERARIDSSGNVGIGTSSPSYKLSVSGNIGLTDGVSTASHALVGGNYYIQNTGAYSTIFQTNGSERARIDSSGKVGIGQTSPQAGIDLGSSAKGIFTSSGVYPYPAGNAYIKVRGTDTEHNWIGITGGYEQSSGSANLILQSNFRFVGEQTGNYIGSETQSVTTADITFGKLVGGSSTGVNATKSEFMRVDSSGNVGIGTTSPTQKLDVNGTVELNNLTVAGAQGSDGQLLTSTGSGVAWEDAPAGGPTFKTFGTSSIMIGDDATGTINAADNNTGVGVDIFAALTSGDRNTAIGFNSLNDLTTGSQNSFVGSYSGDAITTGNYNSGVGDGALGNTTEGSNNSGFGRRALFKNTTASHNTAVGYGALEENTTGTANAALGTYALDANTSGAYNTSIGYGTLTLNTTGNDNTAVGINSLAANTTAANNTAVGSSALEGNTTGTANVAVGHQTMDANTTGDYNTAVGKSALGANTTADNNTAVGYAALTANTTGTANTAVGVGALYVATTGNDNTVMGRSAGEAVTTGYQNVIIGRNAGFSTVGTTTGHSNTIIGYTTHAAAVNGNLEVVIGSGIRGVGNGYTTLGGGSNRTYNQQGSASWSGASDERLKTDVVDEPIGLNFINDLRPVKFKWKKKKDVDSSTFPTIYEEGSDERVQPSEHGVDKHGFIAQELESTIANYSDMGDAGHEIFKQTSDGMYNASPSALIPMLVKAIQELSAKVKVLEG